MANRFRAKLRNALWKAQHFTRAALGLFLTLYAFFQLYLVLTFFLTWQSILLPLYKGIPAAVVGLYLLRGAPLVVSFCYPDEANKRTTKLSDQE